MKYFLKRCGFQELGSIGEDGKPKRGRYLLSSHFSEVVSLFPPLSREIPNDTAVLPIIPLYTRKKTYCNYVYHNSKYTGTDAKHKRNEYRIYLNNILEGNRLYLEAGDIVVIRKSAFAEIQDAGETVYFMDVIKDHCSGLYVNLSRVIEKSPAHGGFGIYDGYIDYFEEQVASIIRNGEVRDIEIDKSVTDRIMKSTQENRNNIFNPATFRDFVLAGYGNACALTGMKADDILGKGLDVVYIRPLQDGGTCMPDNGIALRSDLSMGFVSGEFSLTNDYQVLVHPESADERLKFLSLRQIMVPQNPFFRPNRDSLEYHRKNIYGSFLEYDYDIKLADDNIHEYDTE